jgi:hypothetical protein
MPPKIKGMPTKAPHSKRFTLMLSGEDAYDDAPPLEPILGLPHERFLLGDRVPIAPMLLLGQSDLSPDPQQIIACLQPVHLHATRDHLILMAQNQIDLTLEESRKLLDLALPYLEEDFDNSILFQGHYDWFIPAGPFASLASYSIDQAHGRNIDWWMPHDTLEVGLGKRWRKLQNEVQMLWHIDDVNAAREQKGLPSINSLWLSGIGKLSDVKTPSILNQALNLYGDHPLLAGLSKHLGIPHQETINYSQLVGGFAWLKQPGAVWPALSNALFNRELDEIELIDFPGGKIRHRLFKAKDLITPSWMFWKQSIPLSWEAIVKA